MNQSADDATPLPARSVGEGGRVSLHNMANPNDRQTSLRVPELQFETDEFGNPYVPVVKAALAYADAGWYVGPVAAGTKHPGSVLGKGWHHQTSRDPQQLAEWFMQADHGIFLHVGRSGAVVLDVDHPENLPPELVFELLASGAPRQTTRTGGADTLQGHYLFAMPPGRLLGNGTGSLGTGWGDIRGANGVIIVAPSRHADEVDGGRYEWVRIGAVPILPTSLANRLPDASPGLDAVDDATLSASLRAWRFNLHPWGLRAVTDAWEVAMRAGESRHNTAVKLAAMAARDARAGLYPLGVGFGALRRLFTEAMGTTAGGGRIESEARARAEWSGIAAWAVGQALGEPEDMIALRRHRATEQAERFAAARTAGQQPQQSIPGAVLLPPASAAPIGEVNGAADGMPTALANGVDVAPMTAPGAPLLPESFWTARPSLMHIRQAAYARRVGADITLGTLMVRMSAMVPPSVRIDAGLGAASLNFYLAAIGPSGAGKTRGGKVARELLACPPSLMPDIGRNHFPFKDQLPIGTGEGVAEAFMGMMMTETGKVSASGEPVLKPAKRVVRHHAAFVVDEGQQLLKMMQRSGATIETTLRTAWTGDILGQANATAETTRIVPEGKYSLSLVAGFQPAVIAPLFDEGTAGGTPQRFVFLNVTDPNRVGQRPAWPGPLEAAEKALRNLHEPLAGVPGAMGSDGAHLGDLAGPATYRLLDVDPAIGAVLDEDLDGIDAGTLVLRTDGLDAHRRLNQLKVAALLALLDGRTSVTFEDWGLAGQVWVTSCAVREQLLTLARTEAASIAAARREFQVGTATASDAAVESAREQRHAARIAHQSVRLARWVHEQGGVKRSALLSKLGSANLRALLPEIIDHMTESGWVTGVDVDGGTHLAPGAIIPPD